MLSCISSHVSTLITLIIIIIIIMLLLIQIITREKGVNGLYRNAVLFLNGLNRVCLHSQIPLKLVLVLMMDMMYGAK